MSDLGTRVSQLKVENITLFASSFHSNMVFLCFFFSGFSTQSPFKTESPPTLEQHSVTNLAPIDNVRRPPNPIRTHEILDSDVEDHDTDDESEEAVTPRLSVDGLEPVEPKDLLYVTISQKTHEMAHLDKDGFDENGSQGHGRVLFV